MSSSTLTRKILPTIVFPALVGVAIKFMLGNLAKSGTSAKLAASCTPTAEFIPPNILPYTNIALLDRRLCGLVSFFHAALAEENLPLLEPLLAGMSILAVIPFVESARKGRSTAIAFPVITGLLYQTFSAAVILPLWWLVFIVTGGADLHRPSYIIRRNTRIVQGQAEGILFSIFVGFLLPTVGMVVFEDPQVTALWQGFPLWMSIGNVCHRLFRPSPKSGHTVVQICYLLCFVLSSSYYIGTVWPRFQDVKQLQHFFLPHLSPLASEGTLELGALEFLKWDTAITIGSMMLGTLWFARSATEFVLLVLWNAVVSVALGPCAAIAGVFLWREEAMEVQRPVEVDAKAKFD